MCFPFAILYTLLISLTKFHVAFAPAPTAENLYKNLPISRINCPHDNKTCILDCTLTEGCMGSILECPPYADCYLLCSMKRYSCYGTQIIGHPNGGILTVESTSNANVYHTWQLGRVYCNGTRECRLSCYGFHNCEAISVYGGSTDSLHIECEGTGTCRQMNIQAPYTTNLSVTCSGTNTDEFTCANMTLNNSNGAVAFVGDSDISLSTSNFWALNIIAPKSGNLTLYSTAENAFYNLSLKGNHASHISLTCSGVTGCVESHISALGVSSFELIATAENALSKSIIVDIGNEFYILVNNTLSMVDTSIYATNGFNDLIIERLATNTIDDWKSINSTLFCGGESCGIVYSQYFNEFLCANGNCNADIDPTIPIPTLSIQPSSTAAAPVVSTTALSQSTTTSPNDLTTTAAVTTETIVTTPENIATTQETIDTTQQTIDTTQDDEDQDEDEDDWKVTMDLHLICDYSCNDDEILDAIIDVFLGVVASSLGSDELIELADASSEIDISSITIGGISESTAEIIEAILENESFTTAVNDELTTSNVGAQIRVSNVQTVENASTGDSNPNHAAVLLTNGLIVGVAFGAFCICICSASFAFYCYTTNYRRKKKHLHTNVTHLTVETKSPSPRSPYDHGLSFPESVSQTS